LYGKLIGTKIWIKKTSNTTCSWHTDLNYGSYRLSNVEIGLTAGVTGQQGMLTPPWHLIPPLIYSEVRLRPFSELLNCISYKTYAIDYWSLFLSFHGINPTVSKTQNVILKRRDEVVITRCRNRSFAGNTLFSLSKRRSTWMCFLPMSCDTVKHILADCGDTALIRYDYFDTKSERSFDKW
jgi:hypothetical protein